MLRELRRQVREQARSEHASPLGPAPQLADPAVGPSLLLAAQALQAPDPLPLRLALERAQAASPFLATSLQRLDAWQQAAATSEAAAVLVRAQVGSGKTAVLAHRVLWLHQVIGVPLEQMAVVTFTNHAAGQLVERVKGLLTTPVGPAAFRWFGTLHGLGRSLLAHTLDPSVLGWRPGFGVLDQHARVELWQRLIKDHHLQIKYANRLADRLRKLAAGQGAQSGNMAKDDHLVRLAELYRLEKLRLNTMDFDDLIEFAADLLARGQQTLPLEALLVDELQDCEPREVELLWALRQPQTRFFAVGDPNQSIYAWRGSNPKLFELMHRAWQCQVYDLPNNYRSTPEILSAARGVLGRGAGEGQLAATRATGAPVGIRQFHDGHLEGLALAERFKALNRQGVAWPQIAVLARTRKQLEVLRAVLQAQQVPCADAAQASWEERPAALWLLRQLAQLGSPDAEVLRAALTDAQRGWLVGRAAGRAALTKALATEPGPWQALQRLVRPAKGKLAGDPRDVAVAERWLGLLQALPETGATDGAGLESALPPLWLRPTHRDYQRDLRHVQSAYGQLATACLTTGAWHTAAAAVLGEGPRDPAGTTASGVRLLTLHAAKGLEFQHVILSGCNQGMVPLASAYADPLQLAEERRLLFVGLTRARDQVEVTWHTRPALPQAQAQPSDWLLGIPAADCHWGDAAVAWAQSAAEAAPPADATALDLPWHEGQPVKHAKYGAGTVLRCDSAEVQVDFGRLGTKAFSLLLCPLQAA